MQCEVQNSAYQVEMMAFNGFPMQISFKFWPSEAPTGHFILVPKSQGNTDFVWNTVEPRSIVFQGDGENE
jgi:hypothetical protein